MSCPTPWELVAKGGHRLKKMEMVELYSGKRWWWKTLQLEEKLWRMNKTLVNQINVLITSCTAEDNQFSIIRKGFL